MYSVGGFVSIDENIDILLYMYITQILRPKFQWGEMYYIVSAIKTKIKKWGNIFFKKWQKLTKFYLLERIKRNRRSVV